MVHVKEGLIGSSYVCPKCGKSMELRERTGKKQNYPNHGKSSSNAQHPNFQDEGLRSLSARSCSHNKHSTDQPFRGIVDGMELRRVWKLVDKLACGWVQLREVLYVVLLLE
ncbi:hypothetical protein TNCV_4192831 [Trichonephila clavipes]|nr:hypothetical protein TNCV_4192831 [Trichonephila clavipes]